MTDEPREAVNPLAGASDVKCPKCDIYCGYDYERNVMCQRCRWTPPAPREAAERGTYADGFAAGQRSYAEYGERRYADGLQEGRRLERDGLIDRFAAWCETFTFASATPQEFANIIRNHRARLADEDL